MHACTMGSNDMLSCYCTHAEVGLCARLVTFVGTFSACCNGVHVVTLTQTGGTVLPQLGLPQQAAAEGPLYCHAVNRHQQEGLFSFISPHPVCDLGAGLVPWRAVVHPQEQAVVHDPQLSQQGTVRL